MRKSMQTFKSDATAQIKNITLKEIGAKTFTEGRRNSFCNSNMIHDLFELRHTGLFPLRRHEFLVHFHQDFKFKLRAQTANGRRT